MIIFPVWYSWIHSAVLAAAAQVSAFLHHVVHWIFRTQKRSLKWGLALAAIAAYGIGLAYLMIDAGWFSAILLILMAPGLIFLAYLLFKAPLTRGSHIRRNNRANSGGHSQQV